MRSEEKYVLEKEVFDDFFRLLCSACGMKDVKENWELLASKADALIRRYAGTICEGLAVDLGLSVMEHIRTVKKQEQGGVVSCYA